MKTFLFLFLFLTFQIKGYNLPKLEVDGNIIVTPIVGDISSDQKERIESEIIKQILNQGIRVLDRKISPILEEINFQSVLSTSQKNDLKFLGASYIMSVSVWKVSGKKLNGNSLSLSNKNLANISLKITSVETSEIVFVDNDFIDLSKTSDENKPWFSGKLHLAVNATWEMYSGSLKDQKLGNKIIAPNSDLLFLNFSLGVSYVKEDVIVSVFGGSTEISGHMGKNKVDSPIEYELYGQNLSLDVTFVNGFIRYGIRGTGVIIDKQIVPQAKVFVGTTVFQVGFAASQVGKITTFGLIYSTTIDTTFWGYDFSGIF